MENLIGMSFKRNIYGLSYWTQKVTEVKVVWEIKDINDLIQVPIIMIKGDVHWFPLSEVIFVRPLDGGQLLLQKLQEKRAEMIKAFLNSKK